MSLCFSLGAFLVSLSLNALEICRLLLLQLGGLLRLRKNILS